MDGRKGSLVVSSGCTARGQIHLHSSASPVTGCPMPYDGLHRPHTQNERHTCRQNSHTLMIKHWKTNDKTKTKTSNPTKMCNSVSKESDSSAWRTRGRCLRGMQHTLTKQGQSGLQRDSTESIRTLQEEAERWLQRVHVCSFEKNHCAG